MLIVMTSMSRTPSSKSSILRMLRKIGGGSESVLCSLHPDTALAFGNSAHPVFVEQVAGLDIRDIDMVD